VFAAFGRHKNKRQEGMSADRGEGVQGKVVRWKNFKREMFYVLYLTAQCQLPPYFKCCCRHILYVRITHCAEIDSVLQILHMHLCSNIAHKLQ